MVFLLFTSTTFWKNFFRGRLGINDVNKAESGIELTTGMREGHRTHENAVINAVGDEAPNSRQPKTKTKNKKQKVLIDKYFDKQSRFQSFYLKWVF